MTDPLDRLRSALHETPAAVPPHARERAISEALSAFDAEAPEAPRARNRLRDWLAGWGPRGLLAGTASLAAVSVAVMAVFGIGPAYRGPASLPAVLSPEREVQSLRDPDRAAIPVLQDTAKARTATHSSRASALPAARAPQADAAIGADGMAAATPERLALSPRRQGAAGRQSASPAGRTALDTALARGTLPPPGDVNTGALLNTYALPAMRSSGPVGTAITRTPWDPTTFLVLIAIAPDGIEPRPSLPTGGSALREIVFTADPATLTRAIRVGEHPVPAADPAVLLFEITPRPEVANAVANGEILLGTLDIGTGHAPQSIAIHRHARPRSDADFAAAVALFGRTLDRTPAANRDAYDAILTLARNSSTGAPLPRRTAFLTLVDRARSIAAPR